MIRSSASPALVVGLWAASALAHESGFHKKLTFTLTPTVFTALVVMDVDSGERCELLREAADEDRDGRLSGTEVTALKQRLVSMATRTLSLGLSGAPLTVQVKESKLSLHEDPRVGREGLSVGVLLEVRHAHPVSDGLELQVTDTSPDFSPVVLQVFQSGAPLFEAELTGSKPLAVRLKMTRSDGG